MLCVGYVSMAVRWMDRLLGLGVDGRQDILQQDGKF
jgi:hypothetical protein